MKQLYPIKHITLQIKSQLFQDTIINLKILKLDMYV